MDIEHFRFAHRDNGQFDNGKILYVYFKAKESSLRLVLKYTFSIFFIIKLSTISREWTVE